MTQYQTVVFDCDGVVLNSNEIKSRAFYDVALAYGEPAAEELLAYHVCHGGVSRYKKFEYFLEVIAPKHGVMLRNTALTDLLDRYAKQVSDRLMDCEIEPGLKALRDKMPNVSWCIVSGGDQKELNTIFSARKISALFDGGIFGSPDDKYTIVKREMASGTIKTPAIFLGDSRLDYEVANSFDMDFIFLSKWTEFDGWEQYCSDHNIRTAHAISCLLDGFNTH